MREAALTFTNASCAHCARLVSNSLRRLDGVQAVEVRRDDQRLVVDYDPTRVSVEGIRSTMEKNGYPTRLLYVAPRSHQQSSSLSQAA